MKEPVTVNGRRCYFDPRRAQAMLGVVDGMLHIRLDDQSNPEAWIEVWVDMDYYGLVIDKGEASAKPGK